MEVAIDTSKFPHRRFNPLLKVWVLVSPHRLSRPWKGQIEKEDDKSKIVADTNSLRPNAIRSNGEQNPNYDSIFIFQNDFPALLNKIENIGGLNNSFLTDTNDFDFFRSKTAHGDCKVMCFHPRSDMTLATMSLSDVENVIRKWKELVQELSPRFDWIQIFENRGEMMGCSNPHPHCQIWSTDYLPHIPSVKDQSLREYYRRFGSPMLCDYAAKEVNADQRVVLVNESWLCLVPFWAEWPFETMLVARRRGLRRLSDLLNVEVTALAHILQGLLVLYNRLFNCEFPYSMGWHGAPTGQFADSDMDHWSLHAIFCPPLLRSASVRKFFVGFELMAESQRDLTPEKAAQILRDL